MATTSDLANTNAIPAGTHAATQYLLYISSGVLYEYDIENNQIGAMLAKVRCPLFRIPATADGPAGAAADVAEDKRHLGRIVHNQ